MCQRKDKNLCFTIFAVIGIVCAIASIVYAICNFCKRECEYGDDEFDFENDDCCDDENCDCCDENGCAFTGDEDFEK